MAVIPRVVTITRRRVITNNTPNPFSFEDVINADLSTNYESNTITVSGLIGSAAIAVIGGQYRLNGNDPTSLPGTISNGDTVSAIGTSSGANSQQTDVVVIIGTASDTFTIMTVEADTAPDPFDFPDVPAGLLSTTYVSDTVTITGINSSAAVSINVSGLTGLVGYSKNGGAFTTLPGTAVDGDTFAVRLTTGASITTTYSTTLTIGGVSSTFSVTTQAEVLGLDFSFASNSQYVAVIAA